VLHELLSGSRVILENSPHGAGAGRAVLFLDASHHHTEMASFENDSNTLWIQDLHHGFSDLSGQSFLDLKSSGKEIDDSSNFAETDDLSFRQVADVGLAVEGKHVVFAH